MLFEVFLFAIYWLSTDLIVAKSILIVDDDKRLRELLEDYLREKNYNIFDVMYINYKL